MDSVRFDARRYAPLLLLAVLLTAPALALPNEGVWFGMRAFIVQAVAFASLLLLLTRLSWSPAGVRRFFTTGPNAAVIALVAWAAFSFVTTAPAVGRGRELASVELLRIACGAMIFFAATYRCGSRQQLSLWATLLLGGGALAAMSGLATIGEGGPSSTAGAFGNSQLLAAFLVALVPAAVVFANQGVMDRRRVTAICAMVLVLAVLFITNNRSAWIGGLTGLLVTGALALKVRGVDSVSRNQRHLWMPILLALAVVGGAFFATPGVGTAISDRAATLGAIGADTSAQWRADLGAAGLHMVAERPLTGWGVGRFPITVGRYTARTMDPVLVEHLGSSLSEIPHNEYVQLAAELGLVGLLLYVAVLGGFFVHGFRALGRIKSDTRRWILIAAMGGVAAECVTMAGNPGSRFIEVNSILWLLLGIGMAASRTHNERREDGEESSPAAAGVVRPLGRLSWQLASVGAVALMAVGAYAQTVGPRAGGPIAVYCFDGSKLLLEVANAPGGTLPQTAFSAQFASAIVLGTSTGSAPFQLTSGQGGYTITVSYVDRRGRTQTRNVRGDSFVIPYRSLARRTATPFTVTGVYNCSNGGVRTAITTFFVFRG